ncbi:MAG: PSD1 and planctomycete cytochrome C domain-containing protein [Planctomycetales bacterium]|nr:PSD1 and planctomycete cytochrome C domain-containing protein [Planctomycetales bacterium]
MKPLAVLFVVACWMTSGSSMTTDPITVDPVGNAQFFENQILPLLTQHCYECHNTNNAAANGQLAFDSRTSLLRGGTRGPVLLAGKPYESLLIHAIKYGDPQLQMPPAGKLTDSEIETLTYWIASGASLPEYGTAQETHSSGIDWNAARNFWSLRPLERVSIPRVAGVLPEATNSVKTDAAEISADSQHQVSHFEFRNPIDSFVAFKHQEKGIIPSAAAERRTLIRRLSFDLMGLPPSLDQVKEFVDNDRPDAYEQLVDRVLASPHFGERWARHWLDLMRYADEFPKWFKTKAESWVYRDWVVRALNEDRPYDEFVKLQLAADLLDRDDTPPENESTVSRASMAGDFSTSSKHNRLAATGLRTRNRTVAKEDYAALGFLGLSPRQFMELRVAPSIIEIFQADEWDERLDAVSRTFLGLTVSCARCHDHKFDPITTRDYYALAGIFASTNLSDRPLLTSPLADQVREAHLQVESLQKDLDKLNFKDDDNGKRMQRQIAEISQSTPEFYSTMAPGIEDVSVFVMPDGPDATKLDARRNQPRDLPVFHRGNPNNSGEIVPRRFLEVFSLNTPVPFQQDSGRRQFADALFQEARALTARVIVNRIWSHYFGHGLVRSNSDFGLQGEPPSHLELLNWLAAEFGGERDPRWALKRLHRCLVNSATYRQTSRVLDSTLETASSPLVVDPENQLLWRMSRRRLDIEPWRDAMLTVGGNFDDTMGQHSLNLDLTTNHRRTLYGTISREEQHDMLRTFDFPLPTSHSPARNMTTTALQQLFVLNSPFITSQADALAERLNAIAGDGTAQERLTQCYQFVFQRDPDAGELELGEHFLSDSANHLDGTANRWRIYIQSLIGLNEFLFID